MLKSAKSLYGNKLGATDGNIGHVKDLYFDDQDWKIRYLVVDTGDWLPGRQVLIPPHALGPAEPNSKILAVKLNKAKIENSPSIATHLPVSRQYEEEYYRYFGWPSYWIGEGMGPIVPMPIPGPGAVDPTTPGALTPKGDPHLRATRAVEGYAVQGTDRVAGKVEDFLINQQAWRICKLVIKTGHRFSGHENEISTNLVQRISYMESTVFVNLTGEQLESPNPDRLAQMEKRPATLLPI
jgi:uncharacterized protein YrrD